MFRFEPMNMKYLNEMSRWEYDEFFPDFDMSAYYESYSAEDGSMKGPGGCDGFAALDQKDVLSGLFEYYPTDTGDVFIGLALSPQKQFRGLGRHLLEDGIAFLKSRYSYRRQYVYLSVRVNNIPAVKLYEKAGFSIHREIKDDNGEITHHEMRRPVR